MQVWLAAVEALVAVGAPLRRLLDRLMTTLSGSAGGPLEVGVGIRLGVVLANQDRNRRKPRPEVNDRQGLL